MSEQIMKKSESRTNAGHTHKCRICGSWFDCWNPYGDSEKKCEADVTPKCKRCLHNELFSK